MNWGFNRHFVRGLTRVLWSDDFVQGLIRVICTDDSTNTSSVDWHVFYELIFHPTHVFYELMIQLTLRPTPHTCSMNWCFIQHFIRHHTRVLWTDVSSNTPVLWTDVSSGTRILWSDDSTDTSSENSHVFYELMFHPTHVFYELLNSHVLCHFIYGQFTRDLAVINIAVVWATELVSLHRNWLWNTVS